MPEIILETDRLILRTQGPADLAVWLDHMNTPAVLLHLGGVREPHQVEATFAQTSANIARFGFGFWFLQMKSDATLIGKAGLSHIDNAAAPPPLHGAIQIGWSLRADYWRQGLATEAARAILDHGFARLDMDRIYAQTSQANIASWRIMEKLNMHRMPELDYTDPEYPSQDNPTIIYSIEKT